MKSKTKKVMIAARVDVSVDKAIEAHCKKTGVSKQRAIETPLAEAYMERDGKVFHTHS